MQRAFVRGLNFHGQLGVGQEIKYTVNTFIENKSPIFKEVQSLTSETGHNLALVNKNQVLYWGFNWDIRSFYRTLIANQTVPILMKIGKVLKFTIYLHNIYFIVDVIKSL